MGWAVWVGGSCTTGGHAGGGRLQGRKEALHGSCPCASQPDRRHDGDAPLTSVTVNAGVVSTAGMAGLGGGDGLGEGGGEGLGEGGGDGLGEGDFTTGVAGLGEGDATAGLVVVPEVHLLLGQHLPLWHSLPQYLSVVPQVPWKGGWKGMTVGGSALITLHTLAIVERKSSGSRAPPDSPSNCWQGNWRSCGSRPWRLCTARSCRIARSWCCA